MIIEWSEYPERLIRTGYKSELDCPKVNKRPIVPLVRWRYYGGINHPRGVVGQSRCELVGSMSPAVIDDPHDLWADFAEGSHHLMEILAPLLGIKAGHNFIEDFRGAILDRPITLSNTPRGIRLQER
jgi:hypothetical protein